MSVQCPICDRRFSIFRWRYNCEECKKTVCRGCLVSMQKPAELQKGNYDFFSVCKTCSSVFETQIENDPVLKASIEAYQKGFKKGRKKGYGEGYGDADSWND